MPPAPPRASRIPPFDERGGLAIPDVAGDSAAGHVSQPALSLIDVSLDDLYHRFVLETPNHAKRQVLWEGWMRFRRDLELYGIPYVTWLGGSFFSNAEAPGDIDLLVIFDAADIAPLSDAA